jgi:hypothetical protein
MNVSCDRIDWSEARRRSAAGTLGEDLREIEGDEDWVQSLSLDDDWCDSGTMFSSACRLYEVLAPHLDPETRELAAESLGRLFTEGGIDDLGAKLDDYIFTFSPERVTEMSRRLNAIDVDRFAPVFESHCPAEERDDFRNFQDFRWYFEQWKKACSEAAEHKHGMLVHMG